jgi:hypothetical protein
MKKSFHSLFVHSLTLLLLCWFRCANNIHHCFAYFGHNLNSSVKGWTVPLFAATGRASAAKQPRARYGVFSQKVLAASNPSLMNDSFGNTHMKTGLFCPIIYPKLRITINLERVIAEIKTWLPSRDRTSILRALGNISRTINTNKLSFTQAHKKSPHLSGGGCQ